jgi:hypothetical protein
MTATLARLFLREALMSASIIPLELTFQETIWAGAIAALATALFTAGFITLGAGLIVTWAQNRHADQLREADELRADQLRDADELRADQLREADELRADQLREADQRHADHLLEADQRHADLQRELSEEHDRRQQDHEHEFQTRRALRESYSQLLVMQRRSRQLSIALNLAEGNARVDAESKAVSAHRDFIDEYHRLALDADKDMWVQLRKLRKALDAMLLWAQEGDRGRCEQLYESARAARQNLEREFRHRLGYKELQDLNRVGDLTKPSGRVLW